MLGFVATNTAVVCRTLQFQLHRAGRINTRIISQSGDCTSNNPTTDRFRLVYRMF